LSGGSNTLQSFSTSVINYDVLRSTNLVTWQTLATVLSQTNGKLNYSDINPPSKNVFYRLQVH